MALGKYIDREEFEETSEERATAATRRKQAKDCNNRPHWSTQDASKCKRARAEGWEYAAIAESPRERPGIRPRLPRREGAA